MNYIIKKIKIKNKIQVVAIGLLIVLFLFSCKSKQLPLNQATKENIVENNLTSVNEKTVINKEITDQLLWHISKIQTLKPECDSITQAYVFQILNSLNAQKKSGDNSYSLKFNEQLAQLELLVNIAETKNKTKDSIHSNTIIKEYHTRVEIPVEVPLKWYEKFLMITGGLTLAFVGFQTFTFLKKKITG